MKIAQLAKKTILFSEEISYPDIYKKEYRFILASCELLSKDFSHFLYSYNEEKQKYLKSIKNNSDSFFKEVKVQGRNTLYQSLNDNMVKTLSHEIFEINSSESLNEETKDLLKEMAYCSKSH